MSEQLPPRTLVAALVTLLAEALDREETRHLSNDRFMADLRGLRARVEAEIESLAGRKRLRLADGEDGSVVADD